MFSLEKKETLYLFYDLLTLIVSRFFCTVLTHASVVKVIELLVPSVSVCLFVCPSVCHLIAERFDIQIQNLMAKVIRQRSGSPGREMIFPGNVTHSI